MLTPMMTHIQDRAFDADNYTTSEIIEKPHFSAFFSPDQNVREVLTLWTWAGEANTVDKLYTIHSSTIYSTHS